MDTLETAIYDEIEKVKSEGVTQQELDRAITNAKANLVRGLNSNMGLAMSLARTHGQQGDWRRLFTRINDLENVTVEDIQSVANLYLNKKNRTVGKIVNKPADSEVTENQSGN